MRDKLKKTFRQYSLLGAVLILFLGTLLCKLDVSMAGMEASRLAVVEAVADQGVFHIENTHFRTVDKVILNNHVYSDKPPTLSWCAAQVSKVITFCSGKNFTNSYAFMVFVMNMLFGCLVNTLVFLWLFALLCRSARGSMKLKLLFALLCACGSWLFSYMTIFSNHVPAALAATGVMVSLDKYRRRHDKRAAAWAGFSGGVLFTLDFVCGAAFLAAAVPAVWLLADKTERLHHALRCAVSGLCVIFFSVSLNHAAYGTVLPLYIGSGGTFTPGTDDKSMLLYFTEMLFTTRGLFSYQPFLLLVFPAVWFMRRKLKANDTAVLAASLAVIAIYGVITNEFGGFCYGFRYLIPVIPVLYFYAAKWVLESRNKKLLLFSAVLGLAGIVPAYIGAYEPMCVAFEGHRSPPGHFTRTIRSTFMSNLLAWSYESDQDSALTAALIEHYGKRDSFRCLQAQYVITKHINALKKLSEDRRFHLTKQAE